MSENKKILTAASIIGAGTLLSRIFGFIRDMVIANMFGAALATDAFFVAFKIPNLLRRLLGEGALSAAFIPLFTDYYSKSKYEAWRFANAVISSLIIVLLFIICAGELFMPWIVKTLSPGFIEIPKKFDLTVLLTRITFPYIFFVSIAAALMGILNSMRHFIVPAFAPVLLNISIIGSALILCPHMDIPITALAIGILIGGCLQLAFHLWAVLRHGIKIKFDFSFSHPGIKKITVLMAPYVVSLGVTQINIFIDTLIASLLSEGSISYLYYADRIVQLPLGIFGTAIGTALLPSLSAIAAKGDKKGMGETITFGLRLALFITIPAMVAQIILALPIVTLLFERGNFDYNASVMTSKALISFSIGLCAFAAVKIISPAYFAIKDTKTPVKIAITAMAANIIMNLILMGPLKHAGIALATSLASILNVSLLIFFIRKKICSINWKEVVESTMKISLASIVMGVACYLFSLYHYDFHASTSARAMSIFFTIVIGIVVYISSAILLKCKELSFLTATIKEKIIKNEHKR